MKLLEVQQEADEGAHMTDTRLSNDELKQAIQDTWQLLYRTGAINDKVYPATFIHYTELLKEQARRACNKETT